MHVPAVHMQEIPTSEYEALDFGHPATCCYYYLEVLHMHAVHTQEIPTGEYEALDFEHPATCCYY
jgi:hypothetical protein